MGDDYLTVQEAAEMIGCSVANVRTLYRRGVLPTVRYGKRTVLVQRRDVEQYRDSARHPGWPRGKPRKPAAPPALDNAGGSRDG